MAKAARARPDRRREIARALYECIRRQGYAQTTLKDIAARAGMSPSHVGYYFENQAAILEYYAEAVCAQNLRLLPDPSEPDLGALLDRIADFCFAEGQTSHGLLGMIQELGGLAVHEPRLHEIKSRHSTQWREYLERVFQRADTQGSPRDAAFEAHALMVGLSTNTFFDEGLDRASALALFRQGLRSIARLDEASPRTARRAPGRPRARRPRSRR